MVSGATMPGLGGLAGLGGAYGGYIQAEGDEATARKKKYEIDQQQAGDQGLGNWLQALNSNQGMQPPMGGPPGGQSPPPGQPPMGGPPPGMQGPPGGQPPMGTPPGGPPGQPPQGMPPPQGGMPMRPPMGGPQMQPPPQPPMGGAPQGGMPPPGGPPGMPPGGPQRPMGGPGQMIYGMQLSQIAQSIKSARGNENMPPEALVSAIGRLTTLMNPIAQQQYKELALQQREEAVNTRERDVLYGINTRANTAAEAQDVTRHGQDVRAQTATDNRISKETIAAAGRDGRQAMFEANLISKEQMDEANRNERGREANQRADVATEGQQTRAETAAEAEAGRATRADTASRDRRYATDTRAKTASEAETGRMSRAELSAETKGAMLKLSIDARKELEEYKEGGRETRFAQGQTTKRDLASLSAETRKEIAKLSADERKGLTEYLEAGRMERSEQARTSREDTATAGRASRENIATANRTERATESQSRLAQGLERINTQRAGLGLPPVGEKDAAEIEKNSGAHTPAQSDADRIADQIASGMRPPVTTGLGMHGGLMVAGSLARRYPEFDQTKATLEYEAARKVVIGLNSTQQIKFQQLGTAVVNTFNKVKADAQKMKLSGITPLNKADIDYLVNVRGNTPAGKLAATYLQDVAFLKGEVANLENGGYAPTESSWAQAKQVINENYGVDEMLATATNAQQLINYRLNALRQLPGTANVSPGSTTNRYMPPSKPEGSQELHYDKEGNRIQ